MATCLPIARLPISHRPHSELPSLPTVLFRVVAADDASAAIVVSGKFHSNEHGWGNFSSTVTVEGPVRISMGTCAWGGDVTVKNADGETVATFNTNTGACYHNDKTGNIASAVYKGNASTLTIAGGSYTPYIAVEKVDPSELLDEYEVSFGLVTMPIPASFPSLRRLNLARLSPFRQTSPCIRMARLSLAGPTEARTMKSVRL